MRLSGRRRCQQHARASAAVAAATARERATVPVRAVQQRHAIRAAVRCAARQQRLLRELARHAHAAAAQRAPALRLPAAQLRRLRALRGRKRQRRCARRARGANSGQRGARRPARLQQRLVVRALARRRRRAAMLHARAPRWASPRVALCVARQRGPPAVRRYRRVGGGRPLQQHRGRTQPRALPRRAAARVARRARAARRVTRAV